MRRTLKNQLSRPEQAFTVSVQKDILIKGEFK